MYLGILDHVIYAIRTAGAIVAPKPGATTACSKNLIQLALREVAVELGHVYPANLGHRHSGAFSNQMPGNFLSV